MTTLAEPLSTLPPDDALGSPDDTAPTPWALALRSRRVQIAGGLLIVIVVLCIGTLWWTAGGEQKLFSHNSGVDARDPPTMKQGLRGIMGYDSLGRSLFARSLLGGTISLAVGLAAATISVVLGVTVGLVAGYRRGWVDAVLMR